MAATRTAHTVWNGDLMAGSGATTLDSSGLGTYDVTWKARTEASEGKTSPEELIAAAHSACFSMAFSHALAQAGHTPEEVNTKADVTFVPGTGITGSHLTMTARVPGLSEEEFQKIAGEAKTGCPVSGALASIEITLDATLQA
ncbi:OsmC family protein [Pseudarthrobacter sp. J75]|uniref:OsmC family protein n=1 Tax=unclassified Pseudarthrobacter TaxID=2647000 RepID=UPI002E80C92E|nr:MULTISPECIES: OsmC family protein [unclassified Pseudarthrobacter]MEE2522730.1 OsmC family protein [Pseudarthrobacter sp. J47]MEE2529591.1 OsmC family protein [Pseudarthrobacter sp. J75]MEE2569641.1 OsmC family protein [Pseudarthrobacter sp. J64]